MSVRILIDKNKKRLLEKLSSAAEFCCEEMLYSVTDPHSYLVYSSHLREYSIFSKKRMEASTINYCPWCGRQLPESLRDEFFRIFYDELHLDRSPNLLDTPGLPEEFKSDEWWKKRGL